ncbi:GNAT family N-acetyltransferase [Xanthomonas oryzae]|uniref:GNAT family N-acetyltransferase n=1 Tax=Xanthomonas oryzae TaxID=347 RepID=UPI0023D94BC4|nr:GNAT family N-acetyltransferase [Xanthomonas oryzae]MDI9069326.1 GNAT family N-acetyltransferase [Xanthomonas oryzae pv. oryzae]MDI9079747.1 GNAT family N-acetyltransferase [Xanthomonas oryzae pv. oryzae]MDI9103817.1 GNAT family N-acetyltransferase [Xanthomonas oryzae pv. oryzae]MDI9912547.1 GNAT family N-acetyltransferase [Xanthomonas oryzae pv. oryzae]WEL00235.1 GNAT family N-acetyltransferase [Xanthomonas oryzae pv. oryzae]
MRGRGLGTALYGKLIEELRGLELHAIIGGVAQPNDASARLHEALGFKKVAMPIRQVDRGLHRTLVGLSCSPLSGVGVSNDLIAFQRHEPRQTNALDVCDTLGHLDRCDRIHLERDAGVGDVVVVDVSERLGVDGTGRNDGHCHSDGVPLSMGRMTRIIGTCPCKRYWADRLCSCWRNRNLIRPLPTKRRAGRG